MKRCFKCKEMKTACEFYAHSEMADGTLNKCKTCTKRDVAENYRKNIHQYVAYEKERFQRPERKQKLKEYQTNRRRNSPMKARANHKTSWAISSGKITKEPCNVCGTTNKVEAHHEDYSKPLAITWLCRKHHLEVHNKQSHAA